MVSRPTDRRTFLKTTGAASTALLAGCLGDIGGSDFPNQPITIKVIAGAGGGYDFYTRLIAKYIQEEELLPVDIRVENLTMSLVGRFNNIYNSEPDGYTYGNVWPGFARFQAQEAEGVEFDVTDITPMPSAGGNLRAITVAPDVDVNNTQEFIAAVNAGELKFYTTGVRSTGTIVPVLFGELSGEYGMEQVMNNYVVYDGSAQGMTGMERGEINARCSSLSSIVQFFESGDLKPITILTNAEEVPELYQDTAAADAETLADIDIDNKDQIESLTSFRYYWNFCGPPGIDEDRANVVRDAMQQAIELDALKQEAFDASRSVSYGASEAVGDDLQAKLDLWGEHLPLLSEMEELATG